MDIMEAIYERRSVRHYSDRKVDKETINTLLEAAVQAPSAMNSQPWAFAVIEQAQLLQDYSSRAKAHLLTQFADDPRMERYRDELSSPDFDLFYGASTLIVIYATTEGLIPTEDCCLAGQNLMLAAYSLGLGSCCIGWARPFLSLPETKAELDISEDLTPVLPIVIGFPRGTTPGVARREPHIVCWR